MVGSLTALTSPQAMLTTMAELNQRLEADPRNPNGAGEGGSGGSGGSSGVESIMSALRDATESLGGIVGDATDTLSGMVGDARDRGQGGSREERARAPQDAASATAAAGGWAHALIDRAPGSWSFGPRNPKGN